MGDPPLSFEGGHSAGKAPFIKIVVAFCIGTCYGLKKFNIVKMFVLYFEGGRMLLSHPTLLFGNMWSLINFVKLSGAI